MYIYLDLKLKPVQRTERVHQCAVGRRGELNQQFRSARRGDGYSLAGAAKPQQNRISGGVSVVHCHKVRYVIAFAPVLSK